MARINLLNWREERRKKIEHDFYIMLAVSVFVAIGIVFAVHLQLNAMIDQQNSRNNYIKTEIKKVEKAIAEIKLLEKKKADLLSRMTVIQQLQGNRSDSVHLLDEMVKVLPEGAHLTKLEQKKNILTFNGVAQSNARVSAYMRNIERTEWLSNPNLKVIQAKKKAGAKSDSDGYSQFTLTSKQSSPNDKKKRRLRAMNINDIDFENIGGWPLGLRLAAASIVIAAILGAGFYFFTQDSITQLEQVKAKEAPLKTEFKNKQGKAANLEAYRAQMVEMESRFGSMLRQLPQKAEVADLLVEISQTGLSNNLEFSLFKPSGEARKEFYAELPVNIKVTGTYHDFGGFATGIAALPRIVTIHDVVMTPLKQKSADDTELEADKKLSISLVAKTYRYLDEEESKPKKKKRRKR